MLSPILTQAGHTTGLYTSPHLYRFNERMKLNGVDITDSQLSALVDAVGPAVAQMREKPTEFEMVTALAFLYFKQQHCDLVVLEAGLGGRLDATDVIDPPEIAVITNLALEHTEVLGDTLEQIAFEKAEIIKAGADVVLYHQQRTLCFADAAYAASPPASPILRLKS